MAPVVAAKNAPPEHFLNATIASQRDNLSRMGLYIAYYTLPSNRECVFCVGFIAVDKGFLRCYNTSVKRKGLIL